MSVDDLKECVGAAREQGKQEVLSTVGSYWEGYYRRGGSSSTNLLGSGHGSPTYPGTYRVMLICGNTGDMSDSYERPNLVLRVSGTQVYSGPGPYKTEPVHAVTDMYLTGRPTITYLQSGSNASRQCATEFFLAMYRIE